VTVDIVSARLTHTGPLAANLRQIDRQECEALGRTPKDALRGGLRCSLEAFTALEGEIPIAMFGVVPEQLMGGLGRVWLLGSDRVFMNPRALLAFGPWFVEHWLQTFERLENEISVNNEAAIRLLRKWGFSIGGEHSVHGGVAFVNFWRERAAIQALPLVA
jgi:hypothetical protein